MIGTIPIDGTPTEVVFAAGKMGRVYAFVAADGKQLWQRPVGTHLHDTGLLPAKKSTLVLPGALGGVETPMAYDGTSLYVPVVNLGFSYTPSSSKPAGKAGFAGGRRARGAEPVDRLHPVARKFPSAVYGAATVSNDVVFTSTLSGKVYALSTRDGSTLWSAQAPSGVNGFARSTATTCSSARGRLVLEAPDQRARRVLDRLAKSRHRGDRHHARCRRNRPPYLLVSRRRPYRRSTGGRR